MIKTILRIGCRHRWILPALCTPVCLLAVLWAVKHNHLFFIVGVSLLVIFFSCLCGTFASGQLVSFALNRLHKHCDPQPLLEETADQLAYVKNAANRSVLTINRAAALMETGEHRQALELLEALDVQKPRLAPSMRLVYYHNLTTAAIYCNEAEKAARYYQDAQTLLPAIRDKEQHATAHRELADLHAALLLSQGHADEALSTLTNHPADNLYQRVHHAFLLAQIALLKKDAQLARTQLTFVVKNGGDLHVSALALTLLERT